MSYSIFYRAMHIQTSKGILPMVEYGDNNVYEWDNKRRARNWYNFHASEKAIYSNWEDLNNAIEKWNTKVEDKREEYRNSDVEWKRETVNHSFGYFEGVAVYGKSTFNTTFNDFRNLIRSGMKYMITIEEAIEKGILYIDNGWGKGITRVENEQQLFDALEDKKWVMMSGQVETVYFIKDTISKMLRNGGKRCVISLKKDNVKKWVGVKDNDMVIVDNEEDAYKFKWVKADIHSLLWRKFDDIDETEVRCA